MKNLQLLAIWVMAIALTTALSSFSAAYAAEEGGLELDFTLPPAYPQLEVAANSSSDGSSLPSDDASLKADQPLQIPADATSIPLGESDQAKSLAELPPPPPQPDSLPSDSLIPEEQEGVAAPSDSLIPQPIEIAPPAMPEGSVGLEFNPFNPEDLEFANLDEPEPSAESSEASTLQSLPDLDRLFGGGPDSLVARAIGSAEGTRTPDGGKTSAYGGHTDPGNGVWNLGTFSYQHGAKTPEEADQKQLDRLKNQALTLEQQAETHGLNLNLAERLNGLDLANQSPRAALSSPGGYIERLKEAYSMGLTGTDAILWARTRAFLNPDTNKWNAPGLGNTVERITADQERRLRAIARAIDAKPLPSEPSLSQLPEPSALPEAPIPPAAVAPTPVVPSPEEEAADRIINFELQNYQLPGKADISESEKAQEWFPPAQTPLPDSTAQELFPI